MVKTKFPASWSFVSIVFFLILFFHFLLLCPPILSLFVADEKSKNYYSYLEKLEGLSLLLKKTVSRENNFSHSKRKFLLIQQNLLENLYSQLRELPFRSEERAQLIYKKISLYENSLKSFLNFQK